jgi:hypothetical protein
MNTLYAIAYMKKGNLEFAYTHAESARQAENTFRVTATKDILRGRIQVVSVAPAVGCECDDHGEQLVYR